MRILKIKQRIQKTIRNSNHWILRFLSVLHRKEVIQPHLPIRLPCYDFTPVANPTFGSVLLAVRLLTSGITGSHGVTGGVYKARERIHRSMLICDYSAITSNSNFIQASCSLQSELGSFLGVGSGSLPCIPLLTTIVVRV